MKYLRINKIISVLFSINLAYSYLIIDNIYIILLVKNNK